MYSPNLHQLFILTWSTDDKWWFVSLTYISCLSDHGKEEVYITVPMGATFTKLFILT